MVTPFSQFLTGMTGAPKLPALPADLATLQAANLAAGRALPAATLAAQPRSQALDTLLTKTRAGGVEIPPPAPPPLHIPKKHDETPPPWEPPPQERHNYVLLNGQYVHRNELARLRQEQATNQPSTTTPPPDAQPGDLSDDPIVTGTSTEISDLQSRIDQLGETIRLLQGGGDPSGGTTVTPKSTTFSLGPNGLRISGTEVDINVPVQSSGRYRSAIAAALRNAGVAKDSIIMLLGEYDATAQGQGELPASQAGSEASLAMADMFNLWLGGPPANVTESLNQQFANLWGPAADVGSQTGADPLDPATLAGMFPSLTQGIDQTGAGIDQTGTDILAQSLANFPDMLKLLGISDPTTAAPTTAVPTTADLQAEWQRLGAQDADTDAFTFYDRSSPVESATANFLNSLMGNREGGSTILDDVSQNLFGTDNIEDLSTVLFGPGLSFEDIQAKYLTAGDNYDADLAATLINQLGQKNYNLLTAALTSAENERDFAASMDQFTETLKLAKQDQQIKVLDSMMELTLNQMRLAETSQNNLRNAQIEAMNTALKSKALTQAEEADIRQNLIAVVDLELQEKRINNDQANFLTSTLLATHELSLRVRELDQRGQIAEADRELEREGMDLTERMGLAGITADILNRQADRSFGREGLAQERELGFATIGQRERESDLNAQVALLNAAMANPYSFAALRSLGGIGGIPGMQGGAAPAAGAAPTVAGAPPALFPGLADLGFQLPPTAQAGTITPAPQFFTGGMPTVGLLNQMDPASLQFLQNVLGFSGTSPQGVATGAAAVTPAAGGFQGLGRTLYG